MWTSSDLSADRETAATTAGASPPGRPPDPRAGPRRDYSIATRLAILVLAVTVPFVAFTAFLVLRYAQSEQALIEETVVARARALAAAVDRELGNAVRAATLLAGTSVRLRAGDLKGFLDQAREAIKIQGLQIILTDATGQQLINTGREFGEPLPRIGRAAQVAGILAAGKPHISDLIDAAGLGRPIIAIDVPVVNARGGPYLVIWALGAEVFQQIARDQQLPANEVLGIVDAQGRRIARWPDREQSIGRPANPSFLTQATAASGSFRNISLDGLPVFISYVRLPRTGWLASVAIPEAEVRAPIRRSTLLIAGGGLGTLVLAAAVIFWAGRRVAVPIAALSRSALALGRGDRPSVLSSGIREVSAVSDSLQAAYELLQRNEAARSAAEQQLRSLAAIVEFSDDAIISSSLDGVVTSWNTAAEHIFGYTAAEMIGQSILRLAVPEHHDDMLEILDRIKRGGRVDHHETRRRHKDGAALDVSLSVSPVYDAGGRIVGVSKIARDITEGKKGEAALRESQSRLQKLQSDLAHVARVNEMGQMASALAHEVNQPLAAATNYIEAARHLFATGDATARERVLTSIDNAGTQILRASQIIRRLRDFVMKGETQRRAEDVSAVIEEASALALTGAGGRELKVQLRSSPDLPPVLIDRIQIQQVVVNLVRNAIEAMEETERRELTVVSELLGSSRIAISVVDTGPGIDPQIAERLFRPFVTTKAKGMGVGLSICRSIIEDHGGELGVAANPEGGTIFRFTLPVARPEAGSRRPPEGGEASQAG